MRLSISKAIAALALIAVAALIAISLLADAGSVSARMDDMHVYDADDDDAANNEPRDYKFSVDEIDGSARDSIEVTITERSPTDPGQVAAGTNFDIDENSAACVILGRVEITLPGEDAPESGAYNSSLGGVAEGVFNLNAPIAATHECGGDGVTAAKTNELMALVSFNHEERGEYQLTVATDIEGTIASSAPINVTINDINEAPMLGVSPTVPNAEGTPVARQLLPTGDDIPDPQYAANVGESADIGETLSVWEPNTTNGVIDVNADGYIEFPMFAADRIGVRVFDEDAYDNAALTYSLMAANSRGAITTTAFRGPFSINASTGAITVSGTLDYEMTDGYVLYIVVTDDDEQTAMSDSAKLTINVLDEAELPFFVRDDIDRMSAQQAEAYCRRDWDEIRLDNVPIITIDENTAIGSVITDYDACDPDGDDLIFAIRDDPYTPADFEYFDIHSGTGQLSVDGALDYEFKSTYAIEVYVDDGRGGQGQLLQRIRLNDIENENITPTPTRPPAPTATPTRVPGAAATPTPTTTPARVSQDVLHRVGALEQLLATLQTLIQSLQGVIAAQDSRIAEQDDKITAQDGRIAALESHIAAGALTPTPTPSPTATPSPTPTATPEPTPASNACIQAIQPGSVSGSWTSACLTANPTHGNTYYARFYTFTLDAAADVTIALTSDKPPYLYMLAGAGTSGDVLHQAGGDGQTSVAITDTLQAGSYTIEATTWQPKTIGDFTLTLTARE